MIVAVVIVLELDGVGLNLLKKRTVGPILPGPERESRYIQPTQYGGLP
jgi:hypothetical protein